MERRAAGQLVDGSGVRDYSSLHRRRRRSRTAAGWRTRRSSTADSKYLQRRDVRRLRRPAAPAVQRGEQLVPDAGRRAATTSRSATTSRTSNRARSSSIPNRSTTSSRATTRRPDAASCRIQRDDYESGPSISKGKIHALFARDKFAGDQSLLRRSRPALGEADRRAATSAPTRSTPTSSRRACRAATT